MGRNRSDDVQVVAAYNAPDRTKFRADPYVCDGSGDHTTINAAIVDSRLSAGKQGAASDGEPYAGVRLSGGDFSLGGAILMRSRGQVFRGAGPGRTILYIESGTFSTTGANTGGPATMEAAVMIAATAAGRSAVALDIGDFYVDGSDNAGTAAVWLDYGAGGSTGAGSEATYGLPTSGTNGDTYNTVSRIRGRSLGSGVGFYSAGPSAPYTRGNNVYDCRFNGVTDYGYYSEAASDCHFNQCHVITDNATATYGFFMGGGNSRLTGCKAAYFLDSGSWGIYITGSRVSVDGCEAQDCQNGFFASGTDLRVTGLRVETQETPCTTAVDLTGASVDETFNVTGLSIHTRGSGTYTTGLRLPTISSTTGVGDHMIQAIIDPTGITNPLVDSAGTSITTLSQLEGSQGRGSYNIRVTGNPGRTLVST